jgi:hypothetical protein
MFANFLAAGKVDNETIQKLQETHKEWDNDDYDFNATKSLLTIYIHKNCKTVKDHDLPTDPDEYGLRIAGDEGFYMTKKTNALTGYLFNINDGSVYIVQYDSEHIVTMAPGLPFDITLFMLATGYHNVEPEFYLEEHTSNPINEEAIGLLHPDCKALSGACLSLDDNKENKIVTNKENKVVTKKPNNKIITCPIVYYPVVYYPVVYYQVVYYPVVYYPIYY